MPLAIQGCYLLALRFSAHLGVGRVTSFSYAYLVASTLVGSTAFSLGLISSAPLTRRGIDAVAAGRHVVHAAWVSLALVGAAAGVFALVGGRIMGVLLGSAYAGGVGRGARAPRRLPRAVDARLGRLRRRLPARLRRRAGAAAAAARGGRASSSASRSGWGCARRAGLAGIAIAIGLSTLLIAGGLLWMLSPRTLAIAALGLARLALAVGAATALAFGALSLALPAIPAAAVGVLLYAAVVYAMRSLGLSEAWTYVRGLH